MHYFFSSESSSSLEKQSKRPANPRPASQPYLGSESQSSNYAHYNVLPIKPDSIFQEDPYSYNFTPEVHNHHHPQSAVFPAPRDISSLPTLTYSPSFTNFNNKGQFSSSNFTYGSHPTSLGSLSELRTYEPYREQFIRPQLTSLADEFLCEEDVAIQGTARVSDENHTLLFHDELPFEERKEEITTDQDLNSESIDPLENKENVVYGPKGWSEEDEKLLRKWAVQYKFDWKKVSKKFANKKYTPHFLKMRYKGYDEGPVPKRVKFTHEEDILIAKCFNEYGVEWDKMVPFFPNRTAVMIKNRYYSHIRKHNKLESLLKEAGQVEVEHPNEGQDERNENEKMSEVDGNQTEENGKLPENLSTENNKEVDGKNRDEIASLKAQIKSLKSLYLLTKRELSKLKNGG